MMWGRDGPSAQFATVQDNLAGNASLSATIATFRDLQCTRPA